MKDALGEIDKEFLELDSGKRKRWLLFEQDNPLATHKEILIPLYARLEATALKGGGLSQVLKIPVAVYKRSWDRGKFVEYQYAGDDRR